MRNKNSKIHSTVPPTFADIDGGLIEKRKMAREQRRITFKSLYATAVIAPASGTSGHAEHRGSAPFDHKPEIVIGQKEAGLQRFEPALTSGLHGTCESYGARGVRTPEVIIDHRTHENRLAATEEGAQRLEKPPRRSLEGIVAVTSIREIALSIEHVWTLKWTGVLMLGTSMLLLTLVLTAWYVVLSLNPAR